MTPDEERRTHGHDSNGLACWLLVLLLAAILVLCVVAIRTSGNWIAP